MSQDKFNGLVNEMFFNILVHKPHESVFYFVERYFPGMTEPPGEWTIYPPGQIEYEEPHKTEHNFVFYKHPFVDVPFSEGRLELMALESKSYFPRVTKTNLWFMFDTRAEAEVMFRELSSRFKSVSKKKKAIRQKGKKIMLFTDEPEIRTYNCFQLMLVKDELSEKKYKIQFTGGYYEEGSEIL